MKYVVYLIVLAFALAMFRLKRENKAAIMLLTMMMFSTVSIEFSPIGQARSIIIVSFVLSELKMLKMHMKQIRNTVIWKSLWIILILDLLTWINSPHLRSFIEVKNFLLGDVICKYLLLAFSFILFSSINSLKPTLKVSLIGLAILTAFGVLNYWTRTADFVIEMTRGQTLSLGDEEIQLGERYINSERFRVSSMFANPFDYGYMCILCLILHVYGYAKRLESRRSLIVSIICCSFGIVSCGCRTVLLCTFICGFTYIFMAYRLKRFINVCIVASTVALISYMYIPPITEKMDTMMTMFERNSDIGGSSLEMRELQYAAVLYHVQDSPLLGRGHNFFNIDMGWRDGTKSLNDRELCGLEGVTMSYILERGFVGLLLWVCFYSTLLAYLIRNMHTDRTTVALGGAIIAAYLSFSNMTGELLSVAPTLFILGYAIKVVELNNITPTTSS